MPAVSSIIAITALAAAAASQGYQMKKASEQRDEQQNLESKREYEQKAAVDEAATKKAADDLAAENAQKYQEAQASAFALAGRQRALRQSVNLSGRGGTLLTAPSAPGTFDTQGKKTLLGA